MGIKNERLSNFLFHYNAIRKTWYAIPRDSYIDYENNKCTNCLKDDTLKGVLEKVKFN